MEVFGCKTVRVACISDTHGYEEAIPGGIPECDILIHAGDISSKGGWDQIRKFNEWGSHIPLPTERKIVIPGNHDLTFQSNPGPTSELLANWTLLNETETTVKGLRIYGTPWSPSFNNWAFGHERGEEAQARWKRLPDGIDILVVHGPPKFYGDLCPNGHVGCGALRNRLESVRPSLTVCGHIHEGQGVYAAPWGTVVNASAADAHYTIGNSAILVHVPVFS